MEEVDERQVARSHGIAPVIAVEVEKVSVVAGGDLDLHAGNGEFLHAKPVEDLRQHGLDAFQHHVLVLSEVHENARAAVFVVDDAAIRAGRNYFAGAEVGFVLQREAHQFL